MSEEKQDSAADEPQTPPATAIEPQGEITLSRMRSEGGKTQWKCERASLASVLHGIKNGTWKAQIEGLRAIRDAEARRRAKPFRQPRLDVFGVYADGAREDEIVAKSGWLVCDYDAKDNPGANWDAIKDVMAACPWTGAVFKSASGNGLKWVIRYAAQSGNGGIDEENELAQFERIRKFITGLFPTLKVDDAKGARRHTFVSYDADAYVAPFLPAVKKFAPLESHDERCFLPLETLLRIYAPIVAAAWTAERTAFDATQGTATWRLICNAAGLRDAAEATTFIVFCGNATPVFVPATRAAGSRVALNDKARAFYNDKPATVFLGEKRVVFSSKS